MAPMPQEICTERGQRETTHPDSKRTPKTTSHARSPPSGGQSSGTTTSSTTTVSPDTFRVLEGGTDDFSVLASTGEEPSASITTYALVRSGRDLVEGLFLISLQEFAYIKAELSFLRQRRCLEVWPYTGTVLKLEYVLRGMAVACPEGV